MTWRTDRLLQTLDAQSPKEAATTLCRKSVPESSSGTAIRRKQRICSCKPPSNALRPWTSRSWRIFGQGNRNFMPKCANSPDTFCRMRIMLPMLWFGTRPSPLMNMTFPHFPWTHCRRSFAVMCWRWRNPRRLPWTWRRWRRWASCPCAVRGSTLSGAMRIGRNLSTPIWLSSWNRRSGNPRYCP